MAVAVTEDAATGAVLAVAATDSASEGALGALALIGTLGFECDQAKNAMPSATTATPAASNTTPRLR